jgi:hypothetical protein
VPEEITKTIQFKARSETLALLDNSVPKIYANGFSLGMTNADAQLILMLFGRPIAVLSFSYTFAKTLSEKLKVLVKNWEDKTNAPLQTTDMIDKAFQIETPKEESK